MSKTIALIFLIATKVSCEICVTSSSVNLTIYRTIDSDLETSIANGKIQLEEDAFHLLVANVTLPKLCANSVVINSELTVLQFLNTSLRDIEPGAFHITPSLALLRIGFNLLTVVKSGVFNRVKTKEVDLSNNLISTIEETAFENMTTLEIVKLNNNLIKELNPNWFLNTSVYKLSFIYNELTHLGGSPFKNLSKKRPLKLLLSANQISRLDADVFRDVSSLDILRLNGNKLTTLPEEIFDNLAIRTLEINNNNLTCFPDGIFQSGIEVLEFFDNLTFECSCLYKTRRFVEENAVKVSYPAIICEDKAKKVNVVYNYNRTYEILLLNI